jgi:HEAT repeat protein
MIVIITNSTKNLLLCAGLGAAIFYSVNYLVVDDSDQIQKIHSLEARIKSLETLLEKKDDDLSNLRLLALRQNGGGDVAAINSVTEICKQVKDEQENINWQAVVDNPPDSIQVLKDLGTFSANDPRSFSEKANELLAKEPTKEKIAIISKAVFDMANDRDGLPDYALQSMYNNQTDPDLKRVIAQVLSSRGNNTLIDNQITEEQLRLQSENPKERQLALINLAKTRSSNAANAVVALLNDTDVDVKLNALLALKATGNQTHIHSVEQLVNDADPAVSSLARDVISDLKNLSDSARTVLSSAEIAAELPLIEHP